MRIHGTGSHIGHDKRPRERVRTLLSRRSPGIAGDGDHARPTRGVLATGTVTGYRLGANLVVTDRGARSVAIPVNGTGTDATYGGIRPQWVYVPARATVTLTINTAP